MNKNRVFNLSTILCPTLSVNQNKFDMDEKMLSLEQEIKIKEKNDTYAIAKEEARRLQIRTDKEYGETRIEIWRYNPCFFSKNGIVDKLSLFLAMKDMDDERIQIELETMINNMIW